MRTRPWFRVHSFAGVVTGLLLFIVCWTGTFATVSHEIDWLLTPALRAGAAQGFDPDAAERAALQHQPAGQLLWMAWPLHEGFAVDVVLKTPTSSMWHAYVDPAILQPQGGNSYFNAQRFFRSLHMSLFLKFGIGIYIVGATGVVLLLSGLTPFVFFKRWWTKFFRFHPRGGARAVTSEVHKIAGLWGLWFVLLIAITGIWYLVEQLLIDVADAKFIYPTPPAFSGPAEPRLPLSTFVLAARGADPVLDVRTIGRAGNGLVYVNGQADHLLVRDRATTLFFEPTTARLVEARQAGDLGLAGRWVEAVDLLHFGTFAGLPTKLIWFVFGLALSVLCLTGAYLHAARLATPGGDKARWRAAVPATLATLVLLGWIVQGGLSEARRFGPVVGGQSSFPDVPLPILAFLAGWVAVTLALLALWTFFVARRPRAGRLLPARALPPGPSITHSLQKPS